MQRHTDPSRFSDVVERLRNCIQRYRLAAEVIEEHQPISRPRASFQRFGALLRLVLAQQLKRHRRQVDSAPGLGQFRRRTAVMMI